MEQRRKSSFEKGRLLGLLCILMLPVAVIAQQEVNVPLGGNSGVTSKAGSECVTNTGWVNRQHADAVFSTWVYARKRAGALQLQGTAVDAQTLFAKNNEGNCFYDCSSLD